MSLHYVPTISDGILLSRDGEVHRNAGVRTKCGESLRARRYTNVSHVQAIVFKLRLCRICYPAHHASGGVR